MVNGLRLGIRHKHRQAFHSQPLRDLKQSYNWMLSLFLVTSKTLPFEEFVRRREEEEEELEIEVRTIFRMKRTTEKKRGTGRWPLHSMYLKQNQQ